MEKGKFLSILNKLQNICNQVNYEESDSDVIYEVLQFSKLANSWDSVYRIANFIITIGWEMLTLCIFQIFIKHYITV